jgi:hypothetical protein
MMHRYYKVGNNSEVRYPGQKDVNGKNSSVMAAVVFQNNENYALEDDVIGPSDDDAQLGNWTDYSPGQFPNSDLYFF